MMREPAQAGSQSPTVARPDRRGLRGRDAEIDAIERLMNDARTSRRAGVMTIVGDVGLGKSALLEHAIAAADGMRVLRCVGAPTEATLPFAGLSQMLRPILGLIGQLPGPQVAALRSVFGLSEDQVEDRVPRLGRRAESAERGGGADAAPVRRRRGPMARSRIRRRARLRRAQDRGRPDRVRRRARGGGRPPLHGSGSAPRSVVSTRGGGRAHRRARRHARRRLPLGRRPDRADRRRRAAPVDRVGLVPQPGPAAGSRCAAGRAAGVARCRGALPRARSRAPSVIPDCSPRRRRDTARRAQDDRGRAPGHGAWRGGAGGGGARPLGGRLGSRHVPPDPAVRLAVYAGAASADRRRVHGTGAGIGLGRGH